MRLLASMPLLRSMLPAGPRRALGVLSKLACSALFALPASALAPQEGGGEGGGAPEGGEEEGAKEQTDVGEWLAVFGGEVHTGTGAVLRGATVLAKDGVIRAIGQGVHIPAEAKRIDAAGLRVYPGLVAFYSSG